MKKSIFLFFAAILCAMTANAETYRYSGEKDGWAGTVMTASTDGFYSYYGPVTGGHQFKIGTSSNQWAYNHSYVSKGFNNTDIQDIGDWGSDNCYTWTSATHYILVYYPNTTINTTNKVKICASTVLPNDAVSEPEPEPEPEPIADVTVHFINSVEWAAVACHHWIPEGAGTSWPGDVLSKTDEIAGYDVYTATFTGAHTSCIFNNNNNGNQTGNLTVEDGKYYEVNTNTWYADKAAAEAALATPIPDETVYLINTGNWSKAMIHTWNGVGGTAWPGVEMTLTGETIEGYAVYSYTAKQGGQANLLFQESENVNKTVDLTWQAGKYYAPLKNEWYDTKEAAAEALAAPVEYEYVYLINTNDWAAAHIYTWTPEVAGWPGAAMTKEAEQIAGKDVYSYKVVKGTTFGGLNFNCGGDECKTGDLTWQAGKYYAPSKDKWYDDAAAAEAALNTPTVITYALMGVGSDWTTGIPMTYDEENNQYVLTNQSISKATDAVKVAKLADGSPVEWYNTVDSYSCAHEMVYDGFDSENIVLEDGTYDFYFKLSNNEIYIEKDLVTIDVILSGMVKNPVSRMGRYSFLSLNDEDDNQLSIMNGSEDAYGDFEVNGYLADYDVTVVGNGTWAVVDGVETLTATLQVEDDNTTIYNVVATVGGATTITLECWDATYTITDPEYNEVTFTGVADGKEFTILVSYFGGEYYSEGEWGETLILGTEVEFDDSDAEEYYLGGTYIDDANNTYEVAIFGAPAVVEPTPDYTRTVTAGKFGTICLPFGSTNYTGMELFECVGSEPGKVYLASVTELEAGVPYIFQATATELAVYSDGTTAPAGNHNGLVGTFVDETVVAAGDYILLNNELRPSNGEAKVNANRAYLVMSDVPVGAPQQMPGRRYIGMSVQGENEATGFENITNGENTTIKFIENGQLIIIRNGEKFNAQGVRF